MWNATKIKREQRRLEEMVYDDVIPQWVADDITSKQGSMDVRAGETLTVPFFGTVPLLSQKRDERKEKHMARRLVDTLVKQYAPDADTAWEWMRKAHEMGWEWANHPLGGPNAEYPLGQRVSKTIATAFSNGAGVYVGICLVGGAVRWGWFRGEEWGPKGRDMVLSGSRSHHETPIAAIAEYALLGEGARAPSDGSNLNDVFGDWDN